MSAEAENQLPQIEMVEHAPPTTWAYLLQRNDDRGFDSHGPDETLTLASYTSETAAIASAEKLAVVYDALPRATRDPSNEWNDFWIVKVRQYSEPSIDFHNTDNTELVWSYQRNWAHHQQQQQY